MPMIDADGCLLNVSVEGRDGGPTLMLSNSLGATLRMWEPQMRALTQLFRVIRYDRRGHGRSSVPPGPYSMERFGRDVIAVLDALDVKKTNWCGLSMGGMVGQWLGANAPDRFDRIVLCNTSSYYADKDIWGERIKGVRAGGMGPMAEGVAARWFTPGFIAREPQAVERLKTLVRNTPIDGYIGCCEAIRDMDHREILHKISAPTLIIAGKHDVATPVETGEFIRDRIPGARMVVLDAAHISNVEQADRFSAEVLGFFGKS